MSGSVDIDARETLERIAHDLRAALAELQVCVQRTGRMRNELPDAQLQLAQVLELTEDAAHQTLEAVEASLPLARGIAAAVAEFRLSCADALARDERVVNLLEEIDAAAAGLKSHLAAVLMAQGFQDITGQIIRRVAALVSELDSHLASAGALADRPDHAEVPRGDNHRGHGPARPGADRTRTVGDQQDVDELLAGLGI